MPFTPIHTYTNVFLLPFIYPDLAKTMAVKLQADATFGQGTLLGTTTTAVNEVQTLTVTGTPTGGTFRLTFKGATTTAIAHNASAATVQAALEALVTIGTGGVTCTGGALPGTAVVITFAGTSTSGRPHPAITFGSNLLTGGTAPTATIAETTKGIQAGAFKAWDGTLVAAPAAPTVSTVSGGTVFGDGTNPEQVFVQITYYNETGETTPSPAVAALFTSANRTLRLAAITGVGASVQGVRVYVNGIRVGEVAAASNNIAQTDFATIAGAGVPPNVNSCFTARDGTHILRGILERDYVIDAEGNTVEMNDVQVTTASIYVSGYFRVGDIVGITANNGPQLARVAPFITGAWNNAEGIFKLG